MKRVEEQAVRFESHGLIFRAPFVLPGLAAMRDAGGSARADVIIERGEVPAELGDASRACGEYDISGPEILMRAPQAGRFLIRDGKRIVVDAQANADPKLIRSYLAGAVLAVLLHQRKAMPLHASCVARDGRAIAFIGESGAGKSTTAMLFRDRGYEVVSDDVITCNMRPGSAAEREITVNPAGRSPKLWDDAADMLEIDGATAEAEYAGMAKGIFDLPPPALTGPPRLEGLFVLRWIYPEDAEPEAVRLGRLEALGLLRKNVYRQPLVGMLALEGEYMARLAALVQTVPAFVLARPHSSRALPELHDCVAQALGDS